MLNRIRNFLRGHKENPEPVLSPAHTAPLGDLLEPAGNQVRSAEIEANQLIFATAQSVGMQRERNEDSLFAFSAVLAERQIELPVGLFVVADGMGGHAHGELASSGATRVVAQQILEHLYLPVLDPNIKTPELSIQEILTKAIQMANSEVAIRAPGGGTTLTAAIVVGEQITIGHVGDSRAYILRPGESPHQLTVDHSMVRRLQELGQLSANDAANHPQRNVLYRALGQPDPVQADVQTFPFPKPGILVLCSDGLWGTLSDDAIYQIVMNQPLRAASQELVDASNQAGGPDNISVILVQYA